MADTNHNKDSEASDIADLPAAISLLALNSMAQPTGINQETDDSTAAISLLALNSTTQPIEVDDLTAATSLLALNSSTQSMAVNEENRPNIRETSLPIKKRLKSPGQCGNNNALSSEECIRHLVNINHNRRYLPPPASRKLEAESCCFIRELSTMDAVGRLYLTRDEAESIPSCPRMTEVPKNTRKLATLMVFDYQDVLWNMMLNCCKYEGHVQYLLSTDAWRDFLHANELGPGDTIFLYKNRDSRINADDYYYVILFWKARDGGFKSFLNLPCKKTSIKAEICDTFVIGERCEKKCRKFW